MKKHKKPIIISITLCILAGITVLTLLYYGILQLHNPSRRKYPIHGVDVSSYQGEIDWEVLASQNIKFAFIKSTEGSGHTDKQFATNWENAQKTDLAIGAYHFFSFESGGKTQAEHFIQTVPLLEAALPPTIDVEFYAGFQKNPPEVEKVQEELTIMIQELREYYGKEPILYATEESYNLYLANQFEASTIWIRGVYAKPKLIDNRECAFWQYSNRKRLKGYVGDEVYIDMNLFYGSEEDFVLFLKGEEANE